MDEAGSRNWLGIYNWHFPTGNSIDFKFDYAVGPLFRLCICNDIQTDLICDNCDLFLLIIDASGFDWCLIFCILSSPRFVAICGIRSYLPSYSAISVSYKFAQEVARTGLDKLYWPRVINETSKWPHTSYNKTWIATHTIIIPPSGWLGVRIIASI